MTSDNVAIYFFRVLAVIGFAVGAAFFAVLVDAWRERRAARAEVDRFARRPKARIVEIGTFVRDDRGKEYPFGFTLDCENRVASFGRGPNGEILCGNWTNAELVEIAKRRKEFE